MWWSIYCRCEWIEKCALLKILICICLPICFGCLSMYSLQTIYGFIRCKEQHKSNLAFVGCVPFVIKVAILVIILKNLQMPQFQRRSSLLFFYSPLLLTSQEVPLTSFCSGFVWKHSEFFFSSSPAFILFLDNSHWFGVTWSCPLVCLFPVSSCALEYIATSLLCSLCRFLWLTSSSNLWYILLESCVW